jgi:hypothetical protein
MPTLWISADDGADVVEDVVSGKTVIVEIWVGPNSSKHLIVETPDGDIIVEIPLTPAAGAGIVGALS